MHYLLFYEVVDDYVARRTEFRDAHLEKAWAASARGELLLGGALGDPADGAALLFRGDSPEVARRFAEADPYVTNGLVRSWRVREWRTVAGEAAAQPLGSPAATGVEPPAGTPVARLWRGRAVGAQADAYTEFVTTRVFPALERIEGNRGAWLLRRTIGTAVEFIALTLWGSMAAVRRFAGAEPERAVIEPEARALLSQAEETVAHFSVEYHTQPRPPK